MFCEITIKKPLIGVDNAKNINIKLLMYIEIYIYYIVRWVPTMCLMRSSSSILMPLIGSDDHQSNVGLLLPQISSSDQVAKVVSIRLAHSF